MRYEIAEDAVKFIINYFADAIHLPISRRKIENLVLSKIKPIVEEVVKDTKEVAEKVCKKKKA